jgi:peptide/nickel transport system permease protein
MATLTTKQERPVPRLSLARVPAEERVPRWVKALLRNQISVAGILLLLVFGAIALFAPWLAPPADSSQPYQIPRAGFMAEPQAPSRDHPMGTTQGQYDIYYGIIWGTRTAFKIGLIVTSLTVVIGGGLGAVSGYAGGWADEILQRVVEVFLAFPFLLAALTMATVLGPKLHNGLISGMVALITFGWPGYARLIRGDVLAVKERDFVVAARALGEPDWLILLRHVVPNAMYSLLVVASLDVGSNVLAFAALSFLGLGANEGYADWGQLLSYARNWIPTLSKYWYIVVYPGLALLFFVLAWNLIGDAFRDALDPKMRGQKL